MEYNIIGKIVLNKDIDKNEDDLIKYLKLSENDILKTLKNIDEINFKSEYTIKDKKTVIANVNTIKKPAHTIFYRIKKSLAIYLGKNMQIGINKFEIEHLKIIFPIERMPLESITIPFLSKLGFNGENNTCTIELENIDNRFITRGNIERIIKRIKEKIDLAYYEGKAEYHQLTYESPKRDIKVKIDPTTEMVNRNWISPASTKGKWIYWTPATKLFKTMEKIVIKELLEPLNFNEIINSNIVSGEDIWLRTGHLEGMPMEIYYVAEPITRNVKEWERFIDLVKITQEIPYEELKKMIQFKPLKGLVYAQCPSINWGLKGKTIANESFPIFLFERTTNSFRYESGGRHGIERVDEFHRIEVVFIDEPKKLLELREKIAGRYKYIFNEILEIEWRMATVTPFYMQQAGDIFKEGIEEGRLGTIDYEAWLPYRGSREESEWLEFQNLSIVGEKYIKAFNIKHQKNDLLWSGCTGIGLERWVSVFLAQHGFNVEEWPKNFKNYLPEMPNPLKFY